MEIVVIAAIIAVGFGAAATWLIATRLPAGWIERGQTEGRYAALSTDDPEEALDLPRMQARTDARRVRRARVRALPAPALMRRLRTHPGGGGAPACAALHPDSARRPPR
ncbi:conserved hypothetical protein [Paraburkholderia sacchari]|uniref:hypothetical protein n=1 Tax=Paraburkholderia sacchari TaxID=159450 RepID=UPI0039A57474